MADFKRIIAVLILVGIIGGLGYAYFYILPPGEAPAETGAPETTSAPAATTSAPGGVIPPVSATPATELPGEEDTFIKELMEEKTTACYICHDQQNTKNIHQVATIVEIDESKGLRRKTCVDCHGPRGPPWSATEQMTDPADIEVDNVTGEYILSIEVPHVIHKTRLLNGRMECVDCHTPNLDRFEMVIPATDLGSGQVMYCENCKIPKDPHPEGGNYVTTHIDKFGQKCGICHPGGVEQIHRLGK